MYECVVPLSAFAHTTTGDEIYAIERREGYWNIDFTLKAIPVEILDSNESFAAISGGSTGGSYIADKWDRPIEDGSAVIPVS